ncbi:MAG: DHH family phosphoesterase [archaeon]
MKRAVILTHGSDMDGLGSHAILVRYLLKQEIKENEIIHYFVEYPEVQEKFEKLEKEIKNACDIYVADFNISELLFDDIFKIIKKLLEKGCRIFWYDHHKWNEGQLKELQKVAKVVVDHKKCGADLVYEEYMLKDPVSRRLAALGHDYDFFVRKYPESIKLSLLINTATGKRGKQMHIVNSFVRGEIYKGQIRKEAEAATAYFKKEARAAVKKTHTILSKPVTKILQKEDPDLDTSELTHEFFKIDKECEILCVWECFDKRNKLSLRRKEGSNIDLSELAKTIPKVAGRGGGGGHAYASGMVIDDIKSVDELAGYIIGAMKRVGLI